MERRPQKKALLKVGYRCNNNCVFCHSAPHRGCESSFSQLSRKIEKARRLGTEMVVFSGGEVTIRPDFLALAEEVARHGMALGLVTNARMFRYGGLLERLLGFGFDCAQVSLCGPDPQMHDRHTRCASFSESLAGLRRLAGRIRQLTVNVVVTGWNLPALTQMHRLAEELPGAAVKFSLVEPEGNALEAFDRLVPALSVAAAAICEALVGRDNFYFDGLPLCLVPRKYWQRESTLREEGFFLMSEAFERDWYPIDEGHRGHGRVCLGCSLRRRCRGVFRMYLERRGEEELHPLDCAVPNSFVLASTGRKVRWGGGCPLGKGRRFSLPDPRRELLVLARPGFAEEYRYEGRDFSDATLSFCLREQGQAYLLRQPSRRADPPSSLQRLELAAPCRVCRLRRLCGGLWRRSRRDGFAWLAARLDKRLRRLRGSVLDIGCGAAGCLDALRPALKRGRLAYLGIDPERLPRWLPAGAEAVRTSFQRFRTQRRFQNILVLRSLNHLGRPFDALKRMADLARPGGRLILLDDLVFAVARHGPPAKGPPFEHRTNLLLEEALELCREAGFAPQQRLSARRTACPAWWLECRKSG